MEGIKRAINFSDCAWTSHLPPATLPPLQPYKVLLMLCNSFATNTILWNLAAVPDKCSGEVALFRQGAWRCVRTNRTLSARTCLHSTSFRHENPAKEEYCAKSCGDFFAALKPFVFQTSAPRLIHGCRGFFFTVGADPLYTPKLLRHRIPGIIRIAVKRKSSFRASE